MRFSARSTQLLAALLALAVLTPAIAAAAVSPVSVEIPYQKFVLDNGLTLLVHEDHKAPIVAVNVWYHVGSKNEKPGKTGFAHLFEHLMFNGSENFDDDYFKAFDAVGATDLNGTTNNDRTNYFQNVPTRRSTCVLLDGVRPHGPPARRDRPGQARRAARRGAEREAPGREPALRRVSEQMITESTFPPGHPYSWTVIGSMEDLDAASLEDVQDWFNSYYGPANAVLVDRRRRRPGDGQAEGRAVLRRHPGRAAGGALRPVGRQAQRHQAPQVRGPGAAGADLQGLERARLRHRRRRPPRPARRRAGERQDRRASTSAWSTTTRSPPTSRLRRRPRDRQPVRHRGHRVSRAATWRRSRRRSTRSCAPARRRADARRAGARRQTGSSPRFVRGIERIGGFGGKSDVLARCQVYTGNADCWQQRLARVQSATADELAAVGREWLSDGQYVLEILPYAERKPTTAGVDRSTLPEPGAAPQPDFPKLQRATLSNGLDLVAGRAPRTPLVRLSAPRRRRLRRRPARPRGHRRLHRRDARRGHREPQLDRHLRPGGGARRDARHRRRSRRRGSRR